MESNALNALLCKAFSERSEDVSAAQRWKRNGIFQAVGKVLGLFDSLGRPQGPPERWNIRIQRLRKAKNRCPK